MHISLPGGETTLIPFHATMLSPGRYTARANFTVPDLPPGRYDVGWAEADTLPFLAPCPSPGNHDPTAVAGGPHAAGVGVSVTFDGSASTDPDGDFLEYEWHFGDGTTGEGVSPTHTYAHEGRYIVTLMVSDGEGGAGHAYARATITAGSPDTDKVPPVTTATSAPPVGGTGWSTDGRRRRSEGRQQPRRERRARCHVRAVWRRNRFGHGRRRCRTGTGDEGRDHGTDVLCD